MPNEKLSQILSSLYQHRLFFILIAVGVTCFAFTRLYIGNQLNVISDNATTSDSSDLYIGDSTDNENLIKDEIVIDLSGAVNSPGVYALPANSRVSDAIEKGNGFAQEADVAWLSRYINLSTKVTDAQKIYIPYVWDNITIDDSYVKDLLIGSAVTPPMSENLDSVISEASNYDADLTINVNSATISELDTLDGIGPVYSQKIVDGRPYKDFTELVSSSGIPAKTLEVLKNKLSY